MPSGRAVGHGGAGRLRGRRCGERIEPRRIDASPRTNANASSGTHANSHAYAYAYADPDAHTNTNANIGGHLE
ncbi:MAG TPA: hypothetical protein VF616_21790 [Duganella sp.]|uniref:hypothetical protein n=1 Tax=Duganella sp. TaxID=1904440 RepID=UPI002ED17A15